MAQKIIIVGDAGVGKTSFVRRLAKEDFKQVYVPTLGFGVKRIKTGGNTFDIWDSAGNEMCKGDLSAFWNKANAVIIMVDANSKDIPSTVAKWENQVKLHCGDIPISIVGNKIDLGNDDGDGVDNMCDMSCKNNDGITTPLQELRMNLAN